MHHEAVLPSCQPSITTKEEAQGLNLARVELLQEVAGGERQLETAAPPDSYGLLCRRTGAASVRENHGSLLRGSELSQQNVKQHPAQLSQTALPRPGDAQVVAPGAPDGC